MTRVDNPLAKEALTDVESGTPALEPSNVTLERLERMDEYAKACAILLEADEPTAQSAEDCEALTPGIRPYARCHHHEVPCAT